MYIEKILKKSKEMRNQAHSLLEENKVMDSLKTISNDVYLLGSVENDLMYDSPDIDIKVLTDNNFKTAKEAFDLFSEKRLFQKIEFGDFEKFPRKNRPNGFIVNLRKEFNGLKWEIEIWFLGKEEIEKALEVSRRIKEKLTEDKKKEILIEKYQREKRGDDKHKLSSHEIYQNILGI